MRMLEKSSSYGGRRGQLIGVAVANLPPVAVDEPLNRPMDVGKKPTCEILPASIDDHGADSISSLALLRMLCAVRELRGVIGRGICCLAPIRPSGVASWQSPEEECDGQGAWCTSVRVWGKCGGSVSDRRPTPTPCLQQRTATPRGHIIINLT